MEKLFQDLTSLYWWVGVVVVGLTINLLSAYLKPRIDRYLEGTSAWWTARTVKEQAAKACRIEQLKKDMELRLSYEVRALGLSMVAFFAASIALFVVSFALLIEDSPKHNVLSFSQDATTVIIFGVSLLILALGQAALNGAVRMRAEVRQARKELETTKG